MLWGNLILQIVHWKCYCLGNKSVVTVIYSLQAMLINFSTLHPPKITIRFLSTGLLTRRSNATLALKSRHGVAQDQLTMHPHEEGVGAFVTAGREPLPLPSLRSRVFHPKTRMHFLTCMRASWTVDFNRKFLWSYLIVLCGREGLFFVCKLCQITPHP